MGETIDSSTVQESASPKQDKARLSQKPPRRAGTLAGKQEMMFIAYNIFSIVLCSGGLIYLVTQAPYLPDRSTQSGDLSQPFTTNQPVTVLLPTLLTMVFAGSAGGTLCNLRGIFKYYREEEAFPTRFAVPFIIRPFMGAAVGIFIFFLGSVITSALSDASTLSWSSLSGRLPYIGLALLAGFGSQEFMERTKEVAKTTFSEAGDKLPSSPQIEIVKWTNSSGPAELTPAGSQELILLYGELQETGNFQWRVFQPGEGICRPAGEAMAVRIKEGTKSDRQTLAEQTAKVIAYEKRISDWRSREITDWCS